MSRRLWVHALLLALHCRGLGGNTEYHVLVDPTLHPLQRTVVQPDGTPMRLILAEHASVVRALVLDADGSDAVAEIDVSDDGTQSALLSGERAAHGVETMPAVDEADLEARHALWRSGSKFAPSCAVPDDAHLEMAAPEIYKAAFVDVAHRDAATGRVLQIGDLYEPADTDPAWILLRNFGLRGIIVAGAVPQGAEHEWQRGPQFEDVSATVEGGRSLLASLGSDWAAVDIVRLGDLHGGCLLLRGLLAAGLRSGMVILHVNGQFPPPLRFASLASLPGVTDEFVAFYTCSLSFALDVLRPHGFRLLRFSGPYAAFVHESRPTQELGPDDPDEFKCYRGGRVWGFADAFPIEFVRDWFFATAGGAEESLRRCWRNASTLLPNLATSPSCVLSL